MVLLRAEFFILQAADSARDAAEGAVRFEIGEVVDNPAGDTGQVKSPERDCEEINHHRFKAILGHRVVYRFKAAQTEVQDCSRFKGFNPICKNLAGRHRKARKSSAFEFQV